MPHHLHAMVWLVLQPTKIIKFHQNIRMHLVNLWENRHVFIGRKVYKVPMISIRIFNAYGPRVKTTGVYGAVFGVFFKQKLENKPLTLVGNGLQKRDFLNVRDVANAFYKSAISKKKNEIYNLGSGKPKKIIDLIKLLGSNKIVKLPTRPGEPDCTWADTKKIKRQINWKPNISFQIWC